MIQINVFITLGTKRAKQYNLDIGDLLWLIMSSAVWLSVFSFSLVFIPIMDMTQKIITAGFVGEYSVGSCLKHN